MIGVSPTVTTPLPPKVGTPRRGKILIVDDEPMIIRVVKRMLATDHDVVTLGGAAEALEMIRAGQRFDAILCDLMMPEMTGMDLHRELSLLQPEQAGRMIFATGGAFTPSSQTFLDSAGAPWIEKPFDVNKLRALINERVR